MDGMQLTESRNLALSMLVWSMVSLDMWLLVNTKKNIVLVVGKAAETQVGNWHALICEVTAKAGYVWHNLKLSWCILCGKILVLTETCLVISSYIYCNSVYLNACVDVFVCPA